MLGEWLLVTDIAANTLDRNKVSVIFAGKTIIIDAMP